VRFLTEEHARPLSRSCSYVGLSRAAWYVPPLDWTVRDAELKAGRGPAQSRLLEVLRAAAKAVPGVEPQADLSSVQGDEARPATGRQAAPAQA